MAETIDDITINYEEEGQLLCKELSKEVLTRGSWTTILFMYQDMDRKTGEYGAAKASIRRYRKSGGRYGMQSKFNISSAKQARELSRILMSWFPEGGADEAEGHEETE